MENATPSGAAAGSGDENPNASLSAADEATEEAAPSRPPPQRRAPFTSLSQVDADLALARALQEQERAYMMLGMGGAEYVSSEAESYEYGEDQLVVAEHGFPFDEAEGSDYEYGGGEEEEDAFDANDDGPVDLGEFENDDAFARAFQDEQEEEEVAARLMAIAGLNDWGAEDLGHHDGYSQDAWQEIDPDELSYEELIALSEVVGTESRGLSADTIASLPSFSYKAQTLQDGNSDQCVICRLDYEEGDSLVMLPCKHMYHTECINKWLQINKACFSCFRCQLETPGFKLFDVPGMPYLQC